MGMKKKIFNVAAALSAAATALPVSAAERSVMQDNNGNSVTVIEYSQTEARDDFAVAEREIDQTLTGEERTEKLKVAFVSQVFQKFAAMDMHPMRAFQYSAMLGRQYFSEDNPYNPRISRITNGGGPFAVRPLSAAARAQLDLGEEAVCLLHSVEPGSFSYNDWYGMQTMRDMREVDGIPESFAQYQHEMVEYHERAHCMRAHEAQADFLATLQMKRKYAGTEHEDAVNSYLHMHKAMRLYFLTISNNQIYYGCGPAVQTAVEYYEANADSIKTEADVWTIHTSNSYPQPTYTMEKLMDEVNFSRQYIHYTSTARVQESAPQNQTLNLNSNMSPS